MELAHNSEILSVVDAVKLYAVRRRGKNLPIPNTETYFVDSVLDKVQVLNRFSESGCDFEVVEIKILPYQGE